MDLSRLARGRPLATPACRPASAPAHPAGRPRQLEQRSPDRGQSRKGRRPLSSSQSGTGMRRMGGGGQQTLACYQAQVGSQEPDGILVADRLMGGRSPQSCRSSANFSSDDVCNVQSGQAPSPQHGLRARQVERVPKTQVVRQQAVIGGRPASVPVCPVGRPRSASPAAQPRWNREAQTAGSRWAEGAQAKQILLAGVGLRAVADNQSQAKRWLLPGPSIDGVHIRRHPTMNVTLRPGVRFLSTSDYEVQLSGVLQ